MAFILRIWISIFCLLQLEMAVAQQLNFDYITSKNGLPQNTIRGIVKDKYGFMWFGTWNGLCRYDGYHFKVYNNIPGDTTSLASSRVHYIFKDKEGTLWIAVFNQEVSRYNYQTDDFTTFHMSALPAHLRDSVNRLQNLAVFEKDKSFLNRFIGPFLLSQTKEHIIFEVPTQPGGLNDNNVNSVYRDDAGLLWVGTGSGGINKADLYANPFKNVALNSGNKARKKLAIRSILTDTKGVWLGTEDNGLLYLDKNTDSQQSVSDQLSGQNIKALFKDDNSNVWIGKRTGLDRYNPRTGEVKKYFNSDIQKDYSRFYAIAGDPLTKDIWLAYYNGILKYDDQTQAFQKQELDFYGRSGAGFVFFDSKSNVWIGTEYSGLIQLKRNTATRQWTDTVVYARKTNHSRSAIERVYAIAEDQQGMIWIGGANGLIQINPITKAMKSYTVKEGLINHYITAVMATQPGFIWFAHKSGLSRLTINTGKIQHYTVQNQGDDYEFVDGTASFDRYTGEMYFGTTQGFVQFKLNEIVDNPFLPRTTFTELQILNKNVQVGDTINGRVVLTRPLHLTSSITLTHDDRSFSVTFSALHYTNPSRNQYAYMLEGQDKDWMNTDASRRVASYSNLPSGKYILKVKSSNSDGVWNQQPAMLSIIVLPPWWRTAWAYTVYVLLLLFLCFFIYRLVHMRQRYHRQILTERIKAEKAQELEVLKSNFFTNVSHEFRTPLTLIVDPLRYLLSKQDATEKEQAHYHVMHRNAQRLLALVNQFLDFRKIESGKIQLKPQRQNLAAFLKNTAAAFDFRAEEQGIHFSVHTQPQFITMGFDADVTGKILYNLLSNAFKFTPSGGTIKVQATAADENPQTVEIIVSDTGLGIPADQLDKIFDPFFQVEGTQQAAGTGVGLSLTRQLVALHRGTIMVSSNPETGTIFTVSLSNLPTEEVATENSMAIVIAEDRNHTSPVATAPQPVHEQPIILLVEDNEDIRQYIKQQLSETYTLREAANGAEGLEKAMTDIPDLIISDVMMPGINGLEMCRQLKTDERTSHIPIILLTARQSDQYEVEGYQTGADAYVVKPFNMEVLQVRIKALIESRERLRELFGQSPEAYKNPSGLSEADKNFITKVSALVETNMSDAEVSVEWLAAQLFMSRTQLYRKIKAVTNQSVLEFVTGVRLSKAAEWLRLGQYTVTEIAFMVGYADASSFSRVFQKQYGVTPKKYGNNS